LQLVTSVGAIFNDKKIYYDHEEAKEPQWFGRRNDGTPPTWHEDEGSSREAYEQSQEVLEG